MLRLENVSVSYDGQTVIEGQNLSLESGSSAALMGPSGGGKTTLLKVCAGLIKPDVGKVSTGDGGIAMVFQEHRLLPDRTAAENVNLVLSDTARTLPEAESMLIKLGLKDALNKYPSELSGGMKRRVALARALVSGGKLLILDEPFKELDSDTRQLAISAIKEYREDRILILATHDASEVEALGCTMYIMKNGRFAAE